MQNEIPAPSKKKISFKDRVTKNGTSKLISIILAISLYYKVQYGSSITRNVQIPVVQPTLPNTLIFSSKIPAFIKVSFTGHYDLMDFSLSEFKLILQNPNPILGTNIYRINLYPEAPQGVSVEYSKEIKLFVDRLILRELTVIPRVKVKLNPDQELGYISSTPRFIILKGPYETLASMSQVKTEELNIDESGEIISKEVLIETLPNFVNFGENQPFQVHLSINILNKKFTPKIIKNIPIRCINKTPEIKMKIAGKNTVDLWIGTNVKSRGVDSFSANVFCPVFYDSEAKAIRPSFLIQNQPIFSVDKNGLDNPQVLKIIPPQVNLEFEL